MPSIETIEICVELSATITGCPADPTEDETETLRTRKWYTMLHVSRASLQGHHVSPSHVMRDAIGKAVSGTGDGLIGEAMGCAATLLAKES